MADIRTIGVCGAGVMGSQLAALFASAGYRSYLFDLDQELAEKGLETARRLRPAPFYYPAAAERVTACNYEDHLDRLGDCDWVVEAIAERLDWKQSLYRKISPHLRPGAVLSSNTSGLPLAELTAVLGEDLRRRFLITHFFNPPRYMRLVEVVPGEATDPEILTDMTAWLGEGLGKGVVRAKDTPNFIANRIGIYGMMLALRLTEKSHLSVEEVDALTGPVMGRPKSATFRTADVVGLDVLADVAQTSYERCPADESRELLAPPPLLAALLERGWLGQKSGQGFYKKADGQILALDLGSLEYRPRSRPRLDAVGVARRFTDPRKRLAALVYNPDPAGRFAWELVSGSLAYAARRLGEIADDVVAIDRAVKWGFGWEMGPFEVWDAIGVEKSVRRMEQESKPVPEVALRLLAGGREAFYGRNGGGRRRYFDPGAAAMEPVPAQDGTLLLADEKARGGEVLRNWSASLVDLGDGIACLELHSALQPDLNPIDGAVLDLLAQALEAARSGSWQGLVISHQGTNFSAGADLGMIFELARSGRLDRLEEVSRAFQELTQAIRYAPVPVVAAPFGLCLGGGFELAAPCARTVALAELYCGAVEVGVGLIPGAGGNLRLLAHLSERFPARSFGPMAAAQKAFETIAYGKVSSSAHEARELGYLRRDSPIVLSRDRLLARAKAAVVELAPGYQPPAPLELFLPGEGGRLAIEASVEGLHKAGKISAHDALIAGKLATVLTGGEHANGLLAAVDEQYLLDLEREAFVSLAGEPLSQARMAHMLKTGKPLRN
jgi:3-hydroxyacyl-CoA dehydrogenase